MTCCCGMSLYKKEDFVMESTNSPNILHESTSDFVYTMKKWLSEIYSPADIEKALHIMKNSKYELECKAKIWTSVNEYSIVVKIEPDNSCVNKFHTYLGASAVSRKPRTGETWNRGNDLSDGKFCEETWRNILKDIIKYETEQVKSKEWRNIIYMNPLMNQNET